MDCPFQWRLRLGLKKLTSPLESVPQHISSPAPVSRSAFANSTNAGTVPELVPRKPGKGHTSEKPPAESTSNQPTMQKAPGRRPEGSSARPREGGVQPRGGRPPMQPGCCTPAVLLARVRGKQNPQKRCGRMKISHTITEGVAKETFFKKKKKRREEKKRFQEKTISIYQEMEELPSEK